MFNIHLNISICMTPGSFRHNMNNHKVLISLPKTCSAPHCPPLRRRQLYPSRESGLRPWLFSSSFLHITPLIESGNPGGLPFRVYLESGHSSLSPLCRGQRTTWKNQSFLCGFLRVHSSCHLRCKHLHYWAILWPWNSTYFISVFAHLMHRWFLHFYCFKLSVT